MYWVTKAGGDAQQYDLYRYDWLTSTWVDAGVNKSGVGSYEKLNLRTQLNDYLAGFDESEAVQNQIWEEVNAMFINARVAMFKSGIGQYYNLSDARFTMMMMKNWRTSWSKNGLRMKGMISLKAWNLLYATFFAE